MRDPLSRLDKAPAPRTAPKRLPRLSPNLDVEELRIMAWRRQGVLVVQVDDVKDELINRILCALGDQLYGPRR